MSEEWGNRDRRGAPRVRARLLIASAAEDRGPFAMETVDISASGAYCLVDRFVPLMTRVKLTLDIPLGLGAEATTTPVKAEGIVVRVEPEAEALDYNPGYKLALFFSVLEQDARSVLEEFIRRQQDRSKEI